MKICEKTLNLLIDSYDFANATNKLPSIKYKRDSIQNYTTLAPLAQGAYGDVFVVQHKETKKIYALKRLAKERIKNHTNSAPFFAERSCLINTINTRWLVSLHTSFQTLKHIYFLMDFYPGGDLLSMLSKLDVLPENDIRFYAGELILALQELHSLGYIHRDIKPDNIFIGSDGHIKLGDFGSCAKTENGVVKSSVSVGTPDYISPEVLCSVNCEAVYSYEVDLWALGVVIYEMVSGYTPFYSTSLTETYKKISKIEYDNTKGSEEVKEVIENLVCDKQKRKSIEEIKKMKFFDGFNFDGSNEVKHIPDKNWNLNFICTDFCDSDAPESGYEGFVGFSYDPNVEVGDCECENHQQKKESDKLYHGGKAKSDIQNKSQYTDNKNQYIQNKNQYTEDNKQYLNDTAKKSVDSLENSNYAKSKESIVKNSLLAYLKKANKTESNNEIQNKIINDKQNNIQNMKDDTKNNTLNVFASMNITHNVTQPNCTKNSTKESRNACEVSCDTTKNQVKIANEKQKSICYDTKTLTYVDQLKLKETLWRSKMYLEYITSQNQLVFYYVDHLQSQNRFLKKEIRKKESKVDVENARCMDDLKKELRQKRGEVKEMQQKIDFEVNMRTKLEDEIKMLRSKICENKSQAAVIFKEFVCKKILIDKVKNKYDLQNMTIKIENDRFIAGEMSESLSNVFIDSIKENEMYFLGEKKKYLVVKVVFMAEREETSHTNKNEDEVVSEIKKEEDIVNALNKMINILKKTNGVGLENVNMQKEGSLKRIEQLKGELRRVKGKNITRYSTKSENENSSEVNEKSVERSIKEFNNHSFATKTFKTQTLCHFCSQWLYGTKDQGYECNDCGMVTHSNCYVLVKESCEMSKAIKKGNSVLFLMRNLEEKEKLIKIFNTV